MSDIEKYNQLSEYTLHKSTTMKAAIEMAQSFALKESATMKTAREMVQSFSLQESASMKMTREIVQSFSLQESASMKMTREIVQSFALKESVTMKAAREMVQSFALQESASIKTTRELLQYFALKEPTAIKAVREISEFFEKRNSSVHLDDFYTLEAVVVELAEASSPKSTLSTMEWYDSQTPSVQLVVGLILAYFINVFSSLSMPLYDDWTYLFEKESTRVASKLVIKTAVNEYNISELSNYRFTDAPILHVRVNPSINAEIIDELEKGKVVKYITKNKRWVQVEFVCKDTGEKKIGWVFSRYLRKFER
tara:strand:+ start:1958 stop:2887 length:930 start_codon:yes stop_codon:yes gene_type:complete